FKSSTQLDFPSSFSYQLKEKSRAFIYTLEDGTECLGMTILDGDQNCGTGDFDRGEIVFKSEHLANHTTGNSFYKLRFYIPHNFKIDNYSGDHNIFQIKTDESPGGSILPLPQFLIQFRHEKSTYSFAKLLFNYGLEFDLGDCLGSLLDENGKVDLQNT